MKVLQKIMLVLIIGACVFMVMPQNEVHAAKYSVTGAIDKINATGSAEVPDKLITVVSKILGFLQVASGFAAIIAVAITGFNFLTGSPDVKKELPSKAIPILVGLVLVFGATSIARFIIGIAA